MTQPFRMINRDLQEEYLGRSQIVFSVISTQFNEQEYVLGSLPVGSSFRPQTTSFGMIIENLIYYIYDWSPLIHIVLAETLTNDHFDGDDGEALAYLADQLREMVKNLDFPRWDDYIASYGDPIAHGWIMDRWDEIPDTNPWHSHTSALSSSHTSVDHPIIITWDLPVQFLKHMRITYLPWPGVN